LGGQRGAKEGMVCGRKYHLKGDRDWVATEQEANFEALWNQLSQIHREAVITVTVGGKGRNTPYQRKGFEGERHVFWLTGGKDSSFFMLPHNQTKKTGKSPKK